MSFINNIKERAKRDIKTIVLPETMDLRVIKAAEKIIDEGIANIILIGNVDKINSFGCDVSKAIIIDSEK